VLSHHERWDGTGYPRGVRAESIPLSARIVAIADAFDAITYQRRYRSARSAGEAAQKIMDGRGTQFDPDLVDLFLSPPVFEQVITVLRDDHGPQPRRVPRRAGADASWSPNLMFRWRTTTTAPRVRGSEPRRSRE